MSTDHTLRFSDARYFDRDLRGEPERRLSFAALSPSGELLAAQADSVVLLLSTETAAELGRLKAPRGGSFRFAYPCFAREGRTLALCDHRGAVYLWEGEGTALRTLSPRLRGVDAADSSLHFDAEGRLLAVRCGALTRVLDARTGAERCRIEQSGDCPELAFSPDGARAVTVAYGDPAAKLWDATTGALLCSLEGHAGDAQAVTFALDGSGLVATADRVGAVRVWNSRDGALLGSFSLEAPLSPGLKLAFAPGRPWLAAMSIPLTQVWDVTTRALLARLPTPRGQDYAASIAWSGDARTLVAVHLEGRIHLWQRVDDEGGAPTARQRLRAVFDAMKARGYDWGVDAVSRDAFARYDREAQRDSSRGGRLWYVEEDLAAAFDAHGALVAPLRMKWAVNSWYGDHCFVQVAFAQAGLVPELGFDSGEVVLRPGDDARSSDLLRILQAFATLRAQGYVAEGSYRETSSAGWEDAREQKPRRGVLFWNHQAHRGCFDPRGRLLRPLAMQWDGDPAVLTAALEKRGLRLQVPATEATAFVLEPQGAAAPATKKPAKKPAKKR